MSPFKKIEEQYVSWDTFISNKMAQYGPKLMRWSLGIIFFWFGVLKFFPGLSSAETLALRTISIISFGYVENETARIILATWECAIGLGLMTRYCLRATLLLLFLQMLGTLTPFLFFPRELFSTFPYAPTLEGQYIIKNLVLISAALIVGATVRGGAMIADPEVAAAGKAKMAAQNRGA